MKKTVIFAPIAEREVLFYLEFCKYCTEKKLDVDIQFISFYQPSNALITSKGYKVWDIYEFSQKNDQFKVSFDKLESHFDIDNLHALTLHEKVTFGLKDTKKILKKYYEYLNGLDLILTTIQSKSSSPVYVLQELGGFVAPLSLYFNCKQKNIPHVFFEPAFFRSHMHFLVDSLNPDLQNIAQLNNSSISDLSQKFVASYFENIKKTQKLVIVEKDIHHYQDMGIKKLINIRNLEKFGKKLINKFFLRHKQEYEWISNHVLRSFRQLINRRRLTKYYTSEIPKEQFVYFPFHVQLDYQLTTRNPEFLNQLALVKHLCEICPKDYIIVAKEHPVSIGGFDFNEMRSLITQNSNFKLLQPMINTHDIVNNARAIVTINSKVGAEAAMYLKDVACLGNGFYWNSGVVEKIDSFYGLKVWLNNLKSKPSTLEEKNVHLYFSHVKENSYAFELYNHNPENILAFNKSILSFLDNYKHKSC